MRAGAARGIENHGGPHISGQGVVQPDEVDGITGPLPYIDVATERLAAAAAIYEDLSKTRLAMGARGMRVIPLGLNVEFFGADLDSLTNRAGAQVSRIIRKHPLWPWLEQYPGLGGVHTGRLMGYIRDPHRFPGSRSLWHYCGLHVVNGRAPRQTKGQKGDWNPKAKTAVLMPGGIAEHIVRNRVPKYRDLYDLTKQRLAVRLDVACAIDAFPGADGITSGVATTGEIVPPPGPGTSSRADAEVESDTFDGAGTNAEGADGPSETDIRHGLLRPFQIDAIARKVAAKAFVADLLTEWKRVAS